MKQRYGALLCAVTLLVSCKMFKETTSNEEHIATQYALFALGSDSAFRIWHFDTDSTVRYHPDSGLFAHSGKFWGQDVRTSQTIYQASIDSNRVIYDKSHLRKREALSVPFQWGMLWGGLFLAAVIASVIYYRRKF